MAPLRGGLMPSSALHPSGGRSAPPTPGDFCGTVVPAPTSRRSALHPGDFLPDEKVTKESPRAAPFGIPQCGVTALFALAALRSGSRRATFCH